MNHQTIQVQKGELSKMLTLFCYPAHKDIRTRIVDALTRTSDARRDGRAKVIRLARRKNAALLSECREAVTRMSSAIYEEMREVGVL